MLTKMVRNQANKLTEFVARGTVRAYMGVLPPKKEPRKATTVRLRLSVLQRIQSLADARGDTLQDLIDSIVVHGLEAAEAEFDRERRRK